MTTDARPCVAEQFRPIETRGLLARVISIKNQPVLVVHRSLQIDESGEMYQPVREYLDRHPHEVMVSPTVAPEPAWDGEMSELVFYRLTDSSALAITLLPWLSARSGPFRDTDVLIVHRSLKLATTDEMYQPVALFLKQHPHSINFGPKVIRDAEMAGGKAEMTIYHLLNQ
ncbi:hypothetical protein P5V64_17055 [Mycobacteroides abscessus subsp. abscessus]|uniref:hypothetical protein n=1 Tax=Mycobacteroides abscessus TaxID=36809 RepID=UPI00266DCB67|nr:hypothetical protein [Mycobacteroides abscessus]MDO3119380.1 hypothetical protein [Mycobacteroides abscessus subsp. abscessus]MDO3324177.1 hypothetical protein [Mycobacteroides abscessus subsp. abscessus]MEC4858815.1 hypothetical protein [Mycobacteroides chelonae]MEC4870166.1 hypothetical protein [Mycobacteroides chelonae]